jgi:hypothetical protein
MQNRDCAAEPVAFRAREPARRSRRFCRRRVDERGFVAGGLIDERHIFGVVDGSAKSSRGVNAYTRPGGEERLQFVERHGAGVEKPAATGEDPVEIIHEDLHDAVRVLRQVFAAGCPRGFFARFQFDQRDAAGIRFAVHPRLDKIRDPEVVHFHTNPGVGVVDRLRAREVQVPRVLLRHPDVEQVSYAHRVSFRPDKRHFERSPLIVRYLPRGGKKNWVWKFIF